MATTRLGLLGSWAAYLGFSAKEAAAVSTPDPDWICLVPADPWTCVVGADSYTCVVPADDWTVEVP